MSLHIIKMYEIVKVLVSSQFSNKFHAFLRKSLAQRKCPWQCDLLLLKKRITKRELLIGNKLVPLCFPLFGCLSAY